jgi:glutamate carboxypeptidase
MIAASETTLEDRVLGEVPEMGRLLIEWASVNSGSYHEAGLLRMLGMLERDFARLPVDIERVLCPGQGGAEEENDFPRYALRVRPRHVGSDEKPILLNGHYDTVYGPEHAFQKVKVVSEDRLRGPGVTDMKGGLVVMFTALKILESSELAGKVPWEVLITPDEEIGSEASAPLLREAAKRCRFGLVYESAYVDGGFVRTRKGSGVYKLVARGRSAHVGRNYEEGRNAILGLAQISQWLQHVAKELDLILNVGRFEANAPLNVVPDVATSWWNVRASDPEAFAEFESVLDSLLDEKHFGMAEDVEFSWSGGIVRPPKNVDPATQNLYDAVERVARGMGLSVSWRDTGGGSDGSNLAAYGLANLDNLGVRGGAIHSDEEFVELASLPERVGLTLEIFRAIAEGKFFE